MNTKCLIVDDDVTIAENTAEYFNMFDVPTAYVTGYDETIEFLIPHILEHIIKFLKMLGWSMFGIICFRTKKSYIQLKGCISYEP